jgi:hypothetical protein
MALRVPYKSYPVSRASRAFGQEIHWWPVLPVRLANQTSTLKTKPFHAVVDSGSSACLFHADFLKPLGLNLKDDIEDSLGGVGRQTFIPVYYHDISILVGIDWKIGVRAGFSEELSIAGLLGRLGFFDAFRVTFDHSIHPPVFEIDKFEHKAIH